MTGNPIYRRDILAAVVSLALSPNLTAGVKNRNYQSKTELKTDLANIIRYIDSDESVSSISADNPDFVPSVLSLVQFNHANLAQKPYAGAVVKKAAVDSDMNTSDFLIVLDTALFKASYNTHPIQQYAYIHRDISNMTALYSELLRPDDKYCPLTKFMQNITGAIKFREDSKNVVNLDVDESQRDKVRYLAVLHAAGFGIFKNLGGNTVMDKVISYYFNPNAALSERLLAALDEMIEHYEDLSRQDKNAWLQSAQKVSGTFASATVDYIYKKIRIFRVIKEACSSRKCTESAIILVKF